MRYILKRYWPVIFAVLAAIFVPAGVAVASVVSSPPPAAKTIQMYDTATHKSVPIQVSVIQKLRAQTGSPKTFWLQNGVIHSAPLHDTMTYNKSTRTEIDSLSK